MKIVAFGDIHGRMEWYDIVQKEQPDLTIFMGDYVFSRDRIPSDQQCGNLEDILNYKEQNPDKVILLRGNHDMEHLGFYWAESRYYDRGVLNWMSTPEVSKRFLNLTQWVFVYEDMIFSHAGISQEWFDTLKLGEPTMDNILKINELPPSETFGFTPNRLSDDIGESSSQPLTWIRPYSLLKCGIPGSKQVVGHTRYDFADEVVGWVNSKDDRTDLALKELWCIDKMPYAYFVIEDGKKEMRVWDLTY